MDKEDGNAISEAISNYSDVLYEIDGIEPYSVPLDKKILTSDRFEYVLGVQPMPLTYNYTYFLKLTLELYGESNQSVPMKKSIIVEVVNRKEKDYVGSRRYETYFDVATLNQKGEDVFLTPNGKVSNGQLIDYLNPPHEDEYPMHVKNTIVENIDNKTEFHNRFKYHLTSDNDKITDGAFYVRVNDQRVLFNKDEERSGKDPVYDVFVPEKEHLVIKELLI